MEERVQSVEMIHGNMFKKLSIHCYGHSSADRGHAYPWRGDQWHLLDIQIQRTGKSKGKSGTDFFKELHASTALSLCSSIKKTLL